MVESTVGTTIADPPDVAADCAGLVPIVETEPVTFQGSLTGVWRTVCIGIDE
jgi:hypothetical protein